MLELLVGCLYIKTWKYKIVACPLSVLKQWFVTGVFDMSARQTWFSNENFKEIKIQFWKGTTWPSLQGLVKFGGVASGDF